MPLHVVGEHAQQDVSPHALFPAMVDGADLEIHGLETAEGALDRGQSLVGAHCILGVYALALQIGADHVDPVQRRLGLDAGLVAAVAEALLGDFDREVLGHLEAPEHPAHAHSDLVLTLEASARADRGRSHLLEFRLGGRE